MINLKDLERAAEDLRRRMSICTDLKSFDVKTVPDDMKIILTVVKKDGSKQERVFQRE